MLNRTLDQVIQNLDEEQFFRINCHQIVHIESMQTIHEYFSRRYKLELIVAPKDE